MSERDAFLCWHCGPLLEPRTRQAWAEWLVQRALDLDPGAQRLPAEEGAFRWGATALAVSSGAFLQATLPLAPDQPAPLRPSTSVSFPILRRDAAAQVFCLLAEQEPTRVDPLDRSQWRFWVVPARLLHAERQSIGLKPLIRAHGEGIAYDALRPALAALQA